MIEATRAGSVTPLAALRLAPGADPAPAVGARLAELVADGIPRDTILVTGPDARAVAPFGGTTCEALALAVVAEFPERTPFGAPPHIVPCYEAEAAFARAAEPLFSADWEAWLGPDVDPDVAGLRAPERFAVAAFRLVRKLRDARVAPDDFLRFALRGAATFYASPPNLASPALLYAVKDEYRSSLAVDAAGLERQRAREVDLAKILAKLYAAYLEATAASGRILGGDAVAEAVALLDRDAAVAKVARARWSAAVVVAAHDLRGGEIDLLERLFPSLRNVTVAGGPDLATRTFAGARPDRLFAAARTLPVDATSPVPPRVLAAARAIVAADGTTHLPPGDGLRWHRAADRDAEIAFVADDVAARLRDGVPPGRIAVLGRTLRTMGPLLDALVARGVPVAPRGDPALAHRPAVLDALGAVWFAVDPFRHAWTLRVLDGPAVALSDASLALLCGEPSDPQTPLFELPAGAEDDRERRWDRRRDLRLATNVVRGDRDADLPDEARVRVQALRARRLRWRGWLAAGGLAAAARAIVLDGGLTLPRAGEPAAATDLRVRETACVLDLIANIAAAQPDADPAAVLDAVVATLHADDPPEIDDARDGRVVVASIDRARHDRFDEVYVVDARAGAFPPYYVPDAFLFSEKLGMVPKDAAGDAAATRTAKFTWYLHRAKLRERYGDEARRTLALALTRAAAQVTVTASGRPTRGVAAPELLAELQALAPDAGVAAAAPCSLAGTPVEIVPLDPPAPRATVAFTGLEEAAGLCGACAARERAALAADTAPLLRAAPGPWREEACDVAVALTLDDGRLVTGRIDALAGDGERRYVVVRGAAAATRAALAARALDAVERERYLRREADGSLAGPFPCDESGMRLGRCDGCGATLR